MIIRPLAGLLLALTFVFIEPQTVRAQDANAALPNAENVRPSSGWITTTPLMTCRSLDR